MEQGDVFLVELSENSPLQERLSAMGKIIAGSGFDAVIAKKDKVAIKIHVGEKNNDTHIAPAIIRVIVDRVKNLGASPFLTETSTLYKGERSNAIDHIMHAFTHGFTCEKFGAPFIMADGLLGNTEIEVPIKGVLYAKVNIAREIVLAETIIAVSHPTGHVENALGACLKNLGMGLSSRIGKLRQHSSIKPRIKTIPCTFCGKCIKWCPEDAIIEKDGKAFIIEEKCIGCGECLAVCNFDSVEYNWGTGSTELQKKVAEHALGVLEGKRDKSFFINVLADMTKDCDCLNIKQRKIQADVGIIAAADPVAIDQATLDLTKAKFGKTIAEASRPSLDATVQLAHAEKIGLGSRTYRLIKL
ncbi:MAG: DUF362 domain-containing protein [Spirochaetota bacterium]